MNTANSESKTSTEQISGLIERVTFHNDESDFCVLRVKVKGQRDDVTVAGSLPSVRGGMAGGGWLVGQRQGTRAAIQSHHSEDRAADHRRGNRDDAQLIRVAERQRPQKHRIDYAENRRIRPDAQGERQNGDGSEAGVVTERSHRVMQVMPQGGQGCLRLFRRLARCK
jgi:hypothetical protein